MYNFDVMSFKDNVKDLTTYLLVSRLVIVRLEDSLACDCSFSKTWNLIFKHSRNTGPNSDSLSIVSKYFFISITACTQFVF